jgi:hypothetical protein
MIKRALVVLLACAAVSASAIALALPATTPDATLGTDGMVRALLQVGGVMWVGGQFSATSDGQSGLSNIVGLDVSTGQRAASVVDVPKLTGSGSIVYDLSTDGTNIYAAGKFTAANGAKNLVAFDAVTGTLTQKFIAPALKSVLFDNGRVLGGDDALQAWLPAGGKDPSWDVTTLHIDASLRAHTTTPAYRDVKPAPGGGYFAACQCDSLTDGGTTYPSKAIVRLNADGSYVPSWKPGGSNPLPTNSTAFGIDVFVDTDGVLLAAGGSDFTDKYNLVTGQKMWRTDTNGSSQAVTRFNDAQGSNYFVGGHYRCLSGTASAGNQTDVFHPRLSALGLNGVLDQSWTVPITPTYNAVWVVAQDSLGRLWIGGEFKKVGGTWSGDSTNTCDSGRPTAKNQISQTYLARFSAGS